MSDFIKNAFAHTPVDKGINLVISSIDYFTIFAV